MNRVSYNKNKNQIRSLTPSNNIDKYTYYILEISPFWKSSLKGSPSAIKIQSEHLADSNDGIYEYSQIWARYGNKGESIFRPNGTNNTINMYQNDQSDSNSLYINEPIHQDDVIRIKISRNYSGVIKFHLTPLMSYGELTNLTKTIVIDQDKVANGDVELTQWSYQITKSLGTIIKDDTSTEHSTEEIKTIVKKETSDAAEIEIKTVDSTIRKRREDPIVSTTYIHHLNITYGFDSYLYDNQIPDTGDVNRCLKFFDIETINIDSIKGGEQECIDAILDQYTPVHTEIIPTGVIHGGSTTVNYILNSSECKLQPNKTYLCICYVVTKTDSAQWTYTDYRYLHTNGIFNEQFGITRDFDELTLPIVPTVDLQFDSNRIKELYLNKNQNTTIAELAKSIKWVSDESTTISENFKYKCQINSNPQQVSLNYDDGLFNLNYSYIPINLQPEVNFEYNDMSGDGVDVIVATKGSSTENDGIHSIDVDYKFNCDVKYQPGELTVGAVLTNLLNSKQDADQNGLFLSEAKGNENTMMFEDDSIFTVGMHNNGGGNQEWYGEVGTTSEGYSTSSIPYDDSVETNSPLEIDLYSYTEDISINNNDKQHYYLKHGSDLIQYPSEKDDCSETLNTYLQTDNPHKFLQESLATRSIVPVFFVTSGFSNDNADKNQSYNTVYAGNIVAGSSPGHGYSQSKEKQREEHNFNQTYPYWYLDWNGINPRGGRSILGTFLLKHIDRKGAYTYIPTNNYFCLSTANKTFANYIEDRDGGNTMSATKYTNVNPYKLYNLRGNYYFGYRQNTQTRYSVGDLLATQLAQLGVIEQYSTPMVVTTDQYTVNDENKEKLKKTVASFIVYSALYTITITESLAQEINLNLTSGSIQLHKFNEKLKSNNLIATKTDNKLTFTEKFTFNPIQGLVPDFSNDSYLACITPYGDVSYRALPKIDNANDLYYWDDSARDYYPYKQNVDYKLYKYGKFARFIYFDEEPTDEDFKNHLISNSLNPNNYRKTGESLLDNFTILNSTDKTTQNIRIPLKHSKHQGLYTQTKTRQNGVLTFNCYRDYSHIDSQRKITNMATIPKIYYYNSDKFWVVDSTQRI